LPDSDTLCEKMMNDAANVEEHNHVEECGNALHTSDISMMQPRAKFTCTFCTDGLLCKTNKDERLVVHYSRVNRLIFFPKPEDCRKTSDVRNMVLVVLKEEVKFKAKPQLQLCFQLPSDICPAGNWIEFLCNVLHLDKESVDIVPHPKLPKIDSYKFTSFAEPNSSTTTAAMPFVHCYHGVHDGVLYPLESGLLFFKPPKFLPRSTLHSISCGRGSNNSKYVDLVCDLDGASCEFTSISRDEVSVLNEYIHGTLIPAMKRDINGVVSTINVKEENNDDMKGDDDNGQVKRRSKRKGIQEARAAIKSQLFNLPDESDDDDDDEEEDNDDDDDDSEDEEVPEEYESSDGEDEDIGHSVEPDELAMLGDINDDDDKFKKVKVNDCNEDVIDAETEGTESEEDEPPPSKKVKQEIY